MLDLSSVTLLGIDCFTPEKTLQSMRRSTILCRFAEVVFATNLNASNPEHLRSILPQVRLVDTQQSEERIEYPCYFGDENRTITGHVYKDYEISVHVIPNEHTHTPFVLFQEWDAGVLNPNAWMPEFEEYDYIGAPWLLNKFAGITSRNCVGNGGFSLKSRRWCQVAGAFAKQYDWSSGPMVSDAWSCRTMHKQFTELGIRYAPESIASRFSCENKPYQDQFGFHGKATLSMNPKLSQWMSV